jgi:hypothetical protein
MLKSWNRYIYWLSSEISARYFIAVRTSSVAIAVWSATSRKSRRPTETFNNTAHHQSFDLCRRHMEVQREVQRVNAERLSGYFSPLQTAFPPREQGCLRHRRRRGGRSQVTFQRERPPVGSIKRWLRKIFLMSRPPLLTRTGIRLSPQFRDTCTRFIFGPRP